MDESDRQIDLALKSYPLAPLPQGFTLRLMKHIKQRQPAFGLTLLDFLLPGFFGLFGMGTVAAVLLTLPLLDPLWLPKLRLAYQVLLVRLAYLPDWLPYFLIVMAISATAGLAGAMLLAMLPLRSWVQARTS
jgi:hypothetical protein